MDLHDILVQHESIILPAIREEKSSDCRISSAFSVKGGNLSKLREAPKNELQ